MRKSVFLILNFLSVSFLLSPLLHAADSNWKLHPIFDEEVTHVVETPKYVYFTSRQMKLNTANQTFLSLFRYDKEGEELVALSPDNLLNSNSIRDVAYNPAKGYLFVLYKDYTIDLIYNNGNVVYIPYYEQSDLTYEKDVHSISVDKSNDRVYLATDFGFVAINDKKHEIAESRIYGQPLKAYSRVGDKFLAVKGNDLLMADASSPRLSLDQYTLQGTFNSPEAIYPLGGDLCLLVGGPVNNKYIKKLKVGDKVTEVQNYSPGTIYNTENNSAGVTFSTAGHIHQFNANGELISIEKPTGYQATAASSHNLSELWTGLKRKGLSGFKKSGDSWSLTRDWMVPNAPATYITTSFQNHPNYGFLMLDYGATHSTFNLDQFSPLQLSGYKQGRWTNYAPAYTNPDRTNAVTSSTGMAIDPDNSNYVYITSYHNGIMRLNLSNPKDILHLSYAQDPDNGNEGFVAMPRPSYLVDWSNISPPYFDKSGNLWMYYADYDDSDDPNPHLYCWTQADRRASTNASNVIFPKTVEVKTSAAISNTASILPLFKTGNGLLVIVNGHAKEVLLMVDTNGTPTDASDDKVYRFPEFTDADGNNIEIINTRLLWEDPATGYVWIAHQTGVCYFVPSQVRNGNYVLNRIKVPRNDGTNLADYLLDGVTVNYIETDGDGRKWFATGGAGVICTTSDGREILEEFNTSNSPLPSDMVYGIGYNSDNNSLMISTEEGYIEYFLPATQQGSDKTDIKAYPNPVRPEYSGYVTITDVPMGSFVKITDIKGNLVKDLGKVTGFEILWDISDSNFNRVKSGVYHIMVSPADESSSFSGVGKILVIS